MCICDKFGYADGIPIGLLNAGNLLLTAIEHAFESLLETTVTSYTKFTRAGLDMIADRIAGITHDNLAQLIFD